MVTRPCLSGTSSCAEAKNTRLYARAALWVTGAAEPGAHDHPNGFMTNHHELPSRARMPRPPERAVGRSGGHFATLVRVTTRRPLRARLATAVSRGAAALSRATGRGDGSVIGGRLGLIIDPDLLAHLAAGRQIALVSGTNRKTTTTRLTAAALGVLGPVATNSYGANMPTGHTSALAKAGETPYAVLEVDEHYLPQVLAATGPKVIALLNLSRDQLDRAKEVAMMAQLWRDALHDQPVHLVANADDPMVVFAAAESTNVTWVAAGQRWHDDSWVCPECGGAIVREGDGPDADWHCTTCTLRRPTPQWRLDGEAVVAPDGSRHVVHLQLPGRVN